VQIFVIRLTDQVSARFIDRGNGWQFWHWHRRGDPRPLAIQPNEMDRQRCFTDAESAAEYFRHRYAGKLPGGAPKGPERRPRTALA
jgi:hypothetical protein